MRLCGREPQVLNIVYACVLTALAVDISLRKGVGSCIRYLSVLSSDPHLLADLISQFMFHSYSRRACCPPHCAGLVCEDPFSAFVKRNSSVICARRCARVLSAPGRFAQPLDKKKIECVFWYHIFSLAFPCRFSAAKRECAREDEIKLQ